MRVLVISNLYPPDFLGGYEIGCMRVVDFLLAAGHTVKVLTSIPPTKVLDEPSHVCRELELSDIYRQKTDVEMQIGARLYNARNASIIEGYLQTGEWDVVYAFNLLGLGALQIIDCLNSGGIPWVWHLMDRVPFDMMRDVPSLSLAMFESGARRTVKASTFIFMSRRLRCEISNDGISLEGNVAYVPGWYADEELPFKQELGNPDGSCKFVSVGTLSFEKGTDLILDAASILKNERNVSVDIDLYGPGDLGKYKKRIEDLGLKECVKVCGIVSPKDVARILPNYSVFLFPTWSREPFGFVALESVMCGLAPIITMGAGVTEFLIENAHYLSIERNPLSLAEKMEILLKDERRRKSISANAQTYVRDNFRLSLIGKQIEKELAAAIATRTADIRIRAKSPAIGIIRKALISDTLREQPIIETRGVDLQIVDTNFDEIAKDTLRGIRFRLRDKNRFSPKVIAMGFLLTLLRPPLLQLFRRVLELEARVRRLEN